MSALLRQYLWLGVVIAILVGVATAVWLAGVAAGPPGPVAPPNIG